MATELAEWELLDNMMLNDDIILEDGTTFLYFNEIKLHIAKNKLKHKFLNNLYDEFKLDEADYDYLMKWYYKRKRYVDTPETREQNRLFLEQRKKEDDEQYQEILELMKK
jgi:hypothetical protein